MLQGGEGPSYVLGVEERQQVPGLPGLWPRRHGGRVQVCPLEPRSLLLLLLLRCWPCRPQGRLALLRVVWSLMRPALLSFPLLVLVFLHAARRAAELRVVLRGVPLADAHQPPAADEAAPLALWPQVVPLPQHQRRAHRGARGRRLRPVRRLMLLLLLLPVRRCEQLQVVRHAVRALEQENDLQRPERRSAQR